MGIRRDHLPARLRPGVVLLTAVATAAAGLSALAPSRAAADATAPPTPYFAWGEGDFGQLGDGGTLTQATPEAVVLPGNVEPLQVVAAGRAGFALGSDSRIYDWGVNYNQDLGDGWTDGTRPFPAAVPLPGDAPAAGIATAGSITVALGKDGSVYWWGTDATAGSPGTVQPLPVQIPLPGGAKAKAVYGGGLGASAAAIGTDGKLFVWGFNTNGELGDGTTTNRSTPEQITLPGETSVASISFGEGFTLAVGGDGRLFSWGAQNAVGQLGDGSTAPTPTPHEIFLPNGVKAAQAVAGGFSGYALGSDGAVYSWGYNHDGELGTGGTTDRHAPGPVALPAGVTASAIAANESAGYAVGTNGKLYDWGDSDGDQLGDGTTAAYRATPAAVTFPGNLAIASVSAAITMVLAMPVPPKQAPKVSTRGVAQWAAAGGTFGATFSAVGAPVPTFALAPGAPAWLAIDAATGTVSGAVPANSGDFSFAVTASNSAGTVTTPVYLVHVGQNVAINGHVTDSVGGPMTDSVVELCAGAGCTPATTDASGAFHLTAVVGDSAVIKAHPSGSGVGQYVAQTVGPFVVPAGGIADENISLSGVSPLPSGTTIQGTLDDGGIPALYWGSPYPVSVVGCANGVGAATIVGQDTDTGDFTYNVIPLTETPPGSGTYTGSIPPQQPMHGPADIETSVRCAPSGPLYPSSGPASGGTPVAVTGSGFTGATAVTFGDTPAAGFSVQGDLAIQATAPAGSGTVPVVVRHGATATTVGQYTYVAVTSISPASGPAAGGTSVVITGTGLASARSVVFGSVAAQFTQVSDTQIDAVAPAGTGTQDVKVITDYGGTTPVAAADRFTYTGIAPAPAATAAAAAAVRPVAPVFPAGALPPAAAGSADSTLTQQIWDWGYAHGFPFIEARIRVLLNGLQGLKHPDCTAGQNTLAAALEASQADALAALTADGGAYIAGLMPGYFSGFALALAEVMAPWIAGAIVVAFFALMMKAAVQVSFGKCGDQKSNVHIDPSGTVVNGSGMPVAGATTTILRADTIAGPFTAVDASSPVLLPNVNPETTSADGGFHWDVTAGYYEVRATAPNCVDPADPSRDSVTIGPYPVPPPQVGLVIQMACTGQAVAAVPSVQALSQGTGSAAGGDTVTITGTGFAPSATVSFGDVAAASVTYVSPTTLNVVTPAGSGTLDVTVHTPGGTSAVTNTDAFYFGSVASVAGLSSHSGSVGGGAAVTVSGKGFTAATGVTFGSVAASAFTVVSDTQIQATVPAASAAGTIDVRVGNPAGISATAATDQYTYTDGSRGTAPVFTAATPPTSAIVGNAYSYQFSASGSPAPIFALNADAPGWLSIDAASGIVHGVPPTGTTSFRYSVTAANAAGSAGAGPFVVSVAASGGTTPPVQHTPVYRDAGADRVGTGITVSQQRWVAAGSAHAVVLATSLNFPDALAGGPLAAKKGGPLLLTDGSAHGLDARVLAEIQRVLPAGGAVYVLGGDAAVNPGITAQLRALGYAVTQFKGRDRTDTALRIARDGMSSPQHVILATGTGFADALAAGPYAAGPFADGVGAPAAIVLSTDATLDPATAGFLAGKTVATVGAQATRAWPTAAKSFPGSDRFDTAARVAREFTGPHAGTQVGIANGIAGAGNPGYPDALTGGAFMASANGPIILVDGIDDTLPVPSAAILTTRAGNTRADIFGGTSVIPPRLATAIVAALNGEARF